MHSYLIKNATIVNENQTFEGDIFIKNERIEKIASHLCPTENHIVIDACGKYVIPGVIDDQVHFREPGLTHKADIFTESRAAVCGGVTTFFEQPNTIPQTTTIERLEEKFSIAQKSSFANYSFFIGGTNDNLEELKRVHPKSCAGVKLFLGSSTGNMLVDQPQVIEQIFSHVDLIIATHCEDENTIKNNLLREQSIYGASIPVERHPLIRSREACFLSSSQAIKLAQKTNARLHIFHLSTQEEIRLFSNDIPLKDKRITTEVCVHHLWFSDEDYASKGALIKWNPSVKSASDRTALWNALIDNRIDVIATDHAPHTWQEKHQDSYLQTPSGGPLVQHSLVAMLEKVRQQQISLEKVVEKMCHNPAIIFQIKDRGFLREGYFADLVIIDNNRPWRVSRENIRYKCGWSPFEGTTFSSKVTHTFVNGHLAFENDNIHPQNKGKRVEFNR